MKKYVVSILSLIFLGLSAFCFADSYHNYNFFVNSSGLDYFCTLRAQIPSSSPNQYRFSALNCGSFQSSFIFSNSFSIWSELSGALFYGDSYRYDPSVYFRSGAVHYTLYKGAPSSLVEVFNKSFPVGSLTDNISILLSTITQLKVNLDRGSFFNFKINKDKIVGSLYNNYFFTGADYGVSGTIIRSFYLPDIGISFVYNTSTGYGLHTIYDDGFTTDDYGKIISFNSEIDGVLTIPLLDYGYGYLTGSKTLLLSFDNNGLFYNLLGCFSSQNSKLKNCPIIDRGYFSDYESFFNVSGFNGIWYNKDLYSSYSNYSLVYYTGGGIFVYNIPYTVGADVDFVKKFNGLYKSFDLSSDSSVPDVLIPDSLSLLTSGAYFDESIKKCLWDINYYNLNTFLCNSIGVFMGSNGVPVLNTSLSGASCLKLIEMYDDNGNLVEKIITCEEAQSYLSGGLFTDSQGNVYYQCLGDSCLYSNTSQYFQSGLVSSSYYNSDSLFFSCPYPIITGFNNILSRFSNIELGQFSIGLPILCFYSSFQAGKNFSLFSGLTSYINIPLMGLISGSDDDRNYLYKFFDIILCIGILMFLLKLYHLTK